MINNKRLLDSFLEYIQIDSESGNEKNFADRMVKELEALGGVVDTDDEFEIIDRLEKMTGTKMPAPLAATKNKAVRFTGSVEKQDMSAVVLDFLKS